MPYIKPENRPQYHEIILDVVLKILDTEENVEKAYLFYDFVYTLIIKSLSPNTLPYLHNEHVVKIVSILPEDIDSKVGELNYIIEAVAWGALEDYEQKPACYALRCYFHGALRRIEKITEKVDEKTGIIIHGVLGDVMQEMYRRKTSHYEDYKMLMNGDIWTNRKLV